MWQQPKTDWQATDDVLCSDYNRIKGNIEFLKELAYTLYFPFPMEEMGGNKTEEDYLYADEINLIANNLELLSAGTYHEDVGEKKIYIDNGPYIDYIDLNRIEGATLEMYNKLNNQYQGRRMLTFVLGEREVF